MRVATLDVIIQKFPQKVISGIKVRVIANNIETNVELVIWMIKMVLKYVQRT
jgi:hypothetical protein